MCQIGAVFRVIIGLLLGPVGMLVWDRIRETFGCALKQFWCWAFNIAIGWIKPAWDASVSALPALPVGDLSSLGQVLSVVNMWVPLMEAAALTTTYFLALGGWVCYRNVKSWIPLLSG